MKTSHSDQKNFDPIDEVLASTGISIPQGANELLHTYFSELMEWNRRMDLTGFKDLGTMVISHLGDTLTVIPLLDKKSHARILDIGTGAGIPGLLIKILRPEVHMTLVDARRRKVSFLRYIISKLGLQGVEAIHSSLTPHRPCPQLPQGDYDVVISRAVGDLLALARLAGPYLAKQGRFILMKGPKGVEEIHRFGPMLEKEGWSIEYVMRSAPITRAKRVIIIGRLLAHKTRHNPLDPSRGGQ